MERDIVAVVKSAATRSFLYACSLIAGVYEVNRMNNPAFRREASCRNKTSKILDNLLLNPAYTYIWVFIFLPPAACVVAASILPKRAQILRRVGLFFIDSHRCGGSHFFPLKTASFMCPQRNSGRIS